MPDASAPPRAFISYTYDSVNHASRVLALANRLRQDGVNAEIDQYEAAPKHGWPLWMADMVANSAFVLMVCTRPYYLRVMGREEIGKGLGGKWEGKLILQELYERDAGNAKFLPVGFERSASVHVPDPARPYTHYFDCDGPGYPKLFGRLTGRHEPARPPLGGPSTLPTLPPKVVGGGSADYPGADAAARLRVLVVEDDTLVGLGLKQSLEKLGHEVVGQAADAAQALSLYESAKPDVVLTDIRLGGDDGIEVARRMLSARRCPIIAISAFGTQDLIVRAGEVGLIGYLIKPVGPEQLAAQLGVSLRRYREAEQLSAEQDDLLKVIESRKLVEAAKAIFMRRLQLDEAEAHKRLQQESQKRRIPLTELARKVIESEALLGDGPTSD